jgi:TonB family protein
MMKKWPVILIVLTSFGAKAQDQFIRSRDLRQDPARLQVCMERVGVKEVGDFEINAEYLRRLGTQATFVLQEGELVQCGLRDRTGKYDWVSRSFENWYWHTIRPTLNTQSKGQTKESLDIASSRSDFNSITLPPTKSAVPYVAVQAQPRSGEAQRTSPAGAQQTSCNSEGLCRVGKMVSAPVPLLTPQAEFSEEARRAGIQGEVYVSVIVDASGNPENPRVVKSLGHGLDEKAIEAVKKYRFKPALKAGTPVPVMITIAVNFRPY